MRRDRGFTVIEILISLFVLGVVLVAIWGLFTLSMKTNTSAGDQTECSVLAQQQMERLKDADYDSLAQGGSIDTPMSGFNESFDTNHDTRNDFRVSWAIAFATAPSSTKGLSAKGISMMSLKVKCESLRAQAAGTGKPKQVLFTSYKTRGTF
jgi:prepilin-type N-terminal cleavage/methylation domain-containing protein